MDFHQILLTCDPSGVVQYILICNIDECHCKTDEVARTNIAGITFHMSQIAISLIAFAPRDDMNRL
ncbi:MAG TPA: hypothetical protein VHO28_04800 [Ignavibacteriales bacterium]|nr:hypothetical protein [Ignavibacteriales bacterium]